MKKCKLCKEKELIGKQKFFCMECWAEIKSKGKTARNWAGGIAGIALLVFTQKDKIEGYFDDNSDDV
jgi:hypothetical protein